MIIELLAHVCRKILCLNNLTIKRHAREHSCAGKVLAELYTIQYF